MVVLGFDFGMRRIGVAIGNLITATAAPLETLDRNGSEWDEIAACIAEWQPRALIVGLPYTEPDLAATREGGTPYGPSHVAGLDSKTPLTDIEKNLCQAGDV